MRKRSRNVRNRTIALKINTYKRLEQYLVELVNLKGTPKVTFDEAVNDLLDNIVSNPVRNEQNDR